MPVLEALARRECRFVVVGSVARMLSGEKVATHDLDVVVDPSDSMRLPLIDALAELGALVERRRGRVPVSRTTLLPWEWGWRALTPYGPTDVIVRFVDGTGVDEHERRASSVTLPSGTAVRCHPTRRQT